MKKLGKKKLIILAVALTFILVAFTGCGDGNDNAPAQGNNAQANNPTATNPPANNQQENNPTTTPPSADNTLTETLAPITELEDNQDDEKNRRPTSCGEAGVEIRRRVEFERSFGVGWGHVS
jgi:ABC-type oligopeptide transport system substrate-binding subunit